jgi:diaminopimelate decarboxylase
MPVETAAELHIGGVPASQLADNFGTPLYVYDAAEIRRCFERISRAVPYAPFRIHYACVTNANVAIMRTIHGLGAGIHANTWGDALMALEAGFHSREIVYTGSNVPGDDLRRIVEERIRVNLNCLSQVRQYASVVRQFEDDVKQACPGLRRVGLRIHLDDRMPYSRMGVKFSEIEDACALAEQEGLSLAGVHYYRGTGTIHIHHFLEPFPCLMEAARQIGEHLEYVDVGGGFGYPYIPGGPDAFDWEYFGARMSEMMEDLSKTTGRRITLLLEPGRSLVASSGFLLTRVIAVDRRAAGGQVAGVDTTVSHISSETYRVYGGYRRIALANRESDESAIPTDVAGCTTFSDDYIGRAPRYDRSDRGILLPPLHEGDLLAVLEAGGYGFAFASNFLNKTRPAEVLVDGADFRLIRRRESYDDLLRLQVY